MDEVIKIIQKNYWDIAKERCFKNYHCKISF